MMIEGWSGSHLASMADNHVSRQLAITWSSSSSFCCPHQLKLLSESLFLFAPLGVLSRRSKGRVQKPKNPSHGNRGLYSTLFQEKPPEKKILFLADFIKN